MRGVRERHVVEWDCFPKADRLLKAKSKEKSAVAELHLFASSLFVHRSRIIPTWI